MIDAAGSRIALIAHDLMKDRMVALAHEFRDVLGRHRLVATGTTARGCAIRPGSMSNAC